MQRPHSSAPTAQAIVDSRATVHALPTPTVTAPWHARRDPQALRRLLLARVQAAQRTPSNSFRRPRPVVQSQPQPVDRVEPGHPPDPQSDPLHQREEEERAAWKRNRQEHRQIMAEHQDFVNRFRAR